MSHVTHVNKSWHTVVASYAAVFVVAPGHPEQGPFFLVQGLLNVSNPQPIPDPKPES